MKTWKIKCTFVTAVKDDQLRAAVEHYINALFMFLMAIGVIKDGRVIKTEETEMTKQPKIVDIKSTLLGHNP